MEDQLQPEAVNELDNFFNLSFDTVSREQLRQIALWSKISSICAFAGYLFSLAAAIFGNRVAGLSEEYAEVAGSLRAGNILRTLALVLVGGIINYFLYRFAVAVGQGVQRMDALRVNTGFNSLRLYFKISGILLIIFLSCILLFVLITVAGAPRY
jgi:hypothetical protein